MTTKGDNKDSNPTQDPYCKATTSPELPWLLTNRTGKNTKETAYSHYVSYLLTSWCRVLLEKLTG